MPVDTFEYVPFDPEAHLTGVLALCRTEGWHGLYSNPEHTSTALTAPGVTTIVALWDGKIAGFAQMQSDGALQAHLSSIAVDRSLRKHGIGRSLVEEAFRRCGGERVDLIADADSEPFYESFSHRCSTGFRVYPQARG